MSGTPSNGVDTVLEVLADGRRRHALDCLGRHEELALADLAEEVAEREAGVPVHELSAERVADVYFSLYHNHVPTLEEVGFVTYHQERDLVTRLDGVERDIERAREALTDLVSA